MSATTRPHSMLAEHAPIESPSTWGQAIQGYALGCVACQELYGDQPPAPARETPMSDTLHVSPVADLIDHDTDDDCPCGPRTEPVRREDGSIGWVIVHHSFDGRETEVPR